MKKSITLFLAASIILSALTGCSSRDNISGSDTDAKKISLKVWGPQEDQSSDGNEGWLNKMCEKFDRDHPEWDITYEFGVCSEGDAGKNIVDDPEGAADVYFFSNDQLGMLIEANAIARLGGKALEQVESSNSDIMIKSVTYNGGVYGIPFTGNTWFMFYDKSVYSEEDIKSLDTMLEKGKVAFPLTTGWYTASFYFAGGGSMFGENGDDASAGIDFGGENGAAVTKYIIDLVKNPNFTVDSQGAGKSGIINGTVSAMFSGTWDANDIEEALGENFGAAPLPTISINGEAKQLRAFAGSKAVAANPNCDEPQAAVALAAFLGSTEAQKEHYEMRNIIPADKALTDDAALKNDIVAIAQSATLESTSVLQPSIPEMSNYWDNAETMMKAIVSGDVNQKNYVEKTEQFNRSLNGSSQ